MLWHIKANENNTHLVQKIDMMLECLAKFCDEKKRMIKVKFFIIDPKKQEV